MKVLSFTKKPILELCWPKTLLSGESLHNTTKFVYADNLVRGAVLNMYNVFRIFVQNRYISN
jgi:hypothetical protein